MKVEPRQDTGTVELMLARHLLGFRPDLEIVQAHRALQVVLDCDGGQRFYCILLGGWSPVAVGIVVSQMLQQQVQARSNDVIIPFPERSSWVMAALKEESLVEK